MRAKFVLFALGMCLCVAESWKSERDLKRAIAEDEAYLRRAKHHNSFQSTSSSHGKNRFAKTKSLAATGKSSKASTGPLIAGYPGVKWSFLQQSAARTFDAQLFSISIDFQKFPTSQKSDSRTSAFREFAQATVRLPVFQATTPGVGLEIHVGESADGASWLLKVANNPPKSADQMADALRWLKAVFPSCSDAKCSDVQAHLQDARFWQRTLSGSQFDDVYAYIYANLAKQVGDLAWFPWAVDVLTTNTAAQLSRIKPQFNIPKFTCASGCSESDIINALCRLPPFQARSVLPATLLVQHACQQFAGKEGASPLSGTTVVGKLSSSQNFGLRTLGDFVMPIVRRSSGEVAFFVQYSGVAAPMNNCLSNAVKGPNSSLKPAVVACLGTIA